MEEELPPIDPEFDVDEYLLCSALSDEQILPEPAECDCARGAGEDV